MKNNLRKTIPRCHSGEARIQPTNPMKNHRQPEAASTNPITPAKRSIWKQLGAGSLSISVFIHLILLAVGVIWIFQVIPETKKEVVVTKIGGRPPSSKSTESKTKVQVRSTMPRVGAKDHISDIVLPETVLANIGTMPTLPSISGGTMSGDGGIGGQGGGPLGRGLGDGDSLLGDAQGPIFKLIPPDMRKRCSKADRLARLRENGGTDACEDAVAKSLQWLKSQQNKDGSWGTSNKSAMTGLVLLAYFGHCETPNSEEFGESCFDGIAYLVSVGMKYDGGLVENVNSQSGPYEHGIATYALGEAATFCRNLKIEVPYLPEVTQKAGQFIIDHQNENGGWAYKYDTKGGHTDTSVVGWQIQALKACDHAKLQFNGMKSCIDKGLKYLDGTQHDNGSFGYTGPSANGNLTGVGVLCHQMWGEHKAKEVRNGVKYIKETTKLDWNTNDSDLYKHYYESQAMMQAGGSYWRSYNDLFRDQLLNNQNSDGTWKATTFTGHGAKPENVIYRSALCTLMLEVYYRFLNSGGGGTSRPGI
jgi:hypothetical protein